MADRAPPPAEPRTDWIEPIPDTFENIVRAIVTTPPPPKVATEREVPPAGESSRQRN